MSNGLHSQAWLIASKMVIGVVVILVTGGTLYLVTNQFAPAPLPDTLLPQDPPVANLPRVMTPPPAGHIGALSQREDPASLHTSESSQLSQGEMSASTEPAPPTGLITSSPPGLLNRSAGSSARETQRPSPPEALAPAVAEPDPPVPEDEPPVEEEGGEFSISGRVLTEAGEPIDGLEVVASLSRLVEQEGPGVARAQEQHTHTETTGEYEFTDLFDGEYMLHTVPTGPYSTTSKRVRAGMEEVTLVVAEARSRMVQGLVKQAPMNTPLVGVTVATASRTSSTDKTGHYELAVPLPGIGQGHSFLRFSHPDYHEQHVTVPGPNRQPGEQITLKDVALEPVEGLAKVEGIVESRQGGTPVPGVRVFLAPNGKPGQQNTLTSPEGTFQFPSVVWGTYTLVVAPKTGYQDFTQSNLQVGEEGVNALTIQLEPLAVGQLTGQLVDPRGEPVRGLTLWLSSLAVRTYTAQPITSDPSGHFVVDDVPAGALQFATRSEPHLQINGLTLQPGAAPFVQLPVDWGLQTLTGQVVTAGGLPLPGAEISLTWSQTAHGVTSRAIRHSTADATGTFRFTQLGPGRHTLNVSAPGYRRTLIEHNVGLNHPTVQVTLAARAS